MGRSAHLTVICAPRRPESGPCRSNFRLTNCRGGLSTSSLVGNDGNASRAIGMATSLISLALAKLDASNDPNIEGWESSRSQGCTPLDAYFHRRSGVQQ